MEEKNGIERIKDKNDSQMGKKPDSKSKLIFGVGGGGEISRRYMCLSIGQEEE